VDRFVACEEKENQTLSALNGFFSSRTARDRRQQPPQQTEEKDVMYGTLGSKRPEHLSGTHIV